MGGLGLVGRERTAAPGGQTDTVRGMVPLLAMTVVVLAAVYDPGEWWQVVTLSVGAVVLAAWAWLGLQVLVAAALTLASICVTLTAGNLEPGLFLLSLLALVLTGFQQLRWPHIALVAVAVAVPIVTVQVVKGADYSPAIWVLGILFPAAMGWAVHRQERLVAELIQARHALADQAVAEERRRVARDVHDLVGHGLAATMVQVTSARHVLRRDIDAADEALATAERVGRASMRELRATLSVLREGDEGGQDAASPPGVDDIPALVDNARGTGLDVTLLTEGEPVQVDQVVGVTLYRIAQEALTNATRHAPEAETTVRLRTDEAMAVLEVASAGQPAAEPDARQPRYGILGMRERAEVVGGQLFAGPVESGWLVRCKVPL